jgi:plastocyanin
MRAMRRRGFGRLVLGGVAATLALSGCSLKDSGTDVANGKKLFVEQCAACHTLARANATGVTGPNLDVAFAQARRDGLGQSTFQGIVHQQILHPNRYPQLDPETHKLTPGMPAGLVKGDDARDVAAYVAQSAARPGEDTGKLASIGSSKAEGAAKEQNGTLDIPVAATGLAYKFATAEANAGTIKVTSENPQPVDHDIAIEGNGVSEKGEIVKDGGTSEFTADLKPGEYTFFCTVPGHREGGMEGKLTVK